MDGYPKTISTLTDGVLISDTIGAKETVVYSAQIYVDESVATSSDTTKVVSDQIQGTGVVNDAQDINTTLAQAMSQCISQGNNGATCINAIQSYDGDELVYDGTTDNNLRYIGANPNNYVSFNGELWRIIGVMNNIDNGSGTKETRLKIIRNESIGNDSWDSSDSTINYGWGVNEWSQADLMTELNSGPYWNRTSGTCYSDTDNESTSCDFSNIGLSNEAKSLIDQSIWHLGRSTHDKYYYQINYNDFYSIEKSDNSDLLCSTYSTYCNDGIPRTGKWTGKVGLMYPSDYVYATSGNSTTNRDSCLSSSSTGWGTNCASTDWLSNSYLTQWTITPDASDHCGGESLAIPIYTINKTGELGNAAAASSNMIRPVVYLVSATTIDGGAGTSSDPYQLSISNDTFKDIIKTNFMTDLKTARGGTRSKDYLECDSTKATCPDISTFNITYISFDKTMDNGNMAYKITYTWTCTDSNTCFYNTNPTDNGSNTYTAYSYYELDASGTIIS